MRRLLAAMLCALLISTGCDVSLPFRSANNGDGSSYLFTLDLEANPETLDPQSATDSASKTVIQNLFEGLLETSNTGEVQPAAAQSYTISSDGLTYLFQLRDDRYWFYDENSDDIIDDGETWRVTADDYVFAFQRIFNPEMESPYADMFACLANGEDILAGQVSYTEIGVQALSETELQFTLDYPNARFLSLLCSSAAMPCSEYFFDTTKGRYGLDEESIASCGAFYLRLWFYDPYGSDNLIYMRRNAANSPARSVYPANLTFHIRESLAETTEDFANGVSDLLVTPVYHKNYVEDSDYSAESVRATTLGFVFNHSEKAFANENIRRALSLGLKLSDLGTDSGGDLMPASGLIAPGVYWNGTSYRERYPDPDHIYSGEPAQNAFQTGMRQLGLSSLDSFRILVCASLMDCDNLLPVIDNWQQLFSMYGFYVSIDEVTEAEYWSRLQSGDYSIAIYAITGTSNDPAAALEQFHSNVNLFGYDRYPIDSQIEALQECTTDDELLAKCAALEELILDDYWFIPVFYKNQYCITTSGNEDLGFNPFSETLNLRNAKHYG